MAVEVIAKFVKEDEVPKEILTEIVHKSCGAFRSEEVTPLVKVDEHYVLVSNYTSRRRRSVCWKIGASS